MAIAQINQAQAVVVGFLGLHAGIVLLLQGFARHQGVGYVLEGGLHGFFIRGHGRLLAQFGHIQAGAQAAPVENRYFDGGGEYPGAVYAVEQAVHLGAAGADAAGDADAGEEGGTGGADIGIGLAQVMLGSADIGAVLQQVGGEAGGQFGDAELFVQRQAGGQVVGHGLVNQHGQGVVCLLAGAQCGGVVGFGRFNQGFHFAQVDGRNHAGVVLDLIEPVGLLTGLQHSLCELHGFFGVAFVEIGFGHGGNQREVGGIARGGAAEVALQCGLVVAAGFAEQVELVGGDAEADGVGFGNVGAAGGAQILRHAGTLAGAAGVDAGQGSGAGDGVLGANCFGIQGGHAQVGVVLQRQGNQGFEARVGKVVFPAGVGGTAALVGGGVVAEIGGHVYFGLLIARRKGAGGEQQAEGEAAGNRF